MQAVIDKVPQEPKGLSLVQPGRSNAVGELDLESGGLLVKLCYRSIQVSLQDISGGRR
jgi:hypothetical protein